MVNYKTRIYYEKDEETMGVEVKLYSDTGENLDNILVTSESKFKELADKILNIDDTYIDKTDLATIIANTQSELQINATKLDGYSSGDFAKKIHSHDTYAQTDHASSMQTYGIGTNDNYGHNKVINNITSTEFRNGESLSAYQGKVLSDQVTNTKKEIISWESITLSGHNSVASYCTLHVNKALKLARITYSRTGVKKGVASSKNASNKNNNPSPYWCVGEKTSGQIYLHTAGAIPDSYAPAGRVSIPLHRGDLVVSINSDGSIGFNNSSGAGSKTGDGVNVTVNTLYHY